VTAGDGEHAACQTIDHRDPTYDPASDDARAVRNGRGMLQQRNITFSFLT